MLHFDELDSLAPARGHGSDGGGVRYVRMRVLMNHSGGGALREFTPPILMRTKVPSRIRTDEAVYSPIYYDSNDTNFYLDPASTSKLNTVDASNFRDRDNTGRFMNPNSGGRGAVCLRSAMLHRRRGTAAAGYGYSYPADNRMSSRVECSPQT